MNRRDGWVRGSGGRRAPIPETVAAPTSSSPITNVPIVPYVPARCRVCHEVDDVRDYGKHATETHIDRYHQCRRCGSKFISRELLPSFRTMES